MITSFKCRCGNKDPRMAYDYSGAVGYEAMVCKICGRYYDLAGEHLADEWSEQFMIHSGAKTKTRYSDDYKE